MKKREQEKGRSEFDKLCHSIFTAKADGMDYLSKDTGVRCGTCGNYLDAYYCESRLFVVECPHCTIKALVMAGSPKEAAFKTFGHAVYPLEEMGEDCAVFFSHTPIDEPSVYVGSVLDSDFPEDVVCGMYLPCPGTDGEEKP